ncbi:MULTISPECIES: carbonate dehydratase [unclassified Neptuniibacter]|jgi:carbonic anhydrase|uniref:carbonate dehydratase n=1 Tax=unclassified Neptuniibacter TaxID=2630693 RepID=UPI000C6BC32D|nr:MULTISPECIES: carbonate dehydratase [unclassified Neptuniibacter]MAY41378.1 carbonate dehydratase [Oceanospirillaceae bacterium]|tara:strand:- start:2857 stop:3585 length:729 start_codon:yes stop_codon:yes gene_type:complete
MKKLTELLESNRQWAEKISKEDPMFFETLAQQQAPEYLWIGCSDSRVPANEIVDMLPGELFVHRNVSNLVVHTDMNCMSVIQYAVEVLKVKHIMVVGHYGCGGVKAAIETEPHGMIDNWLRNIRNVYKKHRDLLSVWDHSHQQLDRLCELNVIEQACNVCDTTIVQQAWANEQELTVHGWIYGLDDGLVNDLEFNASDAEEVDDQYRLAISKIEILRKLAQGPEKETQTARSLWDKVRSIFN